MKYLIWILKTVFVLALAVAGLVAGSSFTIGTHMFTLPYFGNVILGTGVLVSTLVFGLLAWFLAGWRRSTALGTGGAILASVFVVAVTLLNPMTSMVNDRDPRPSIVWANPLNFLDGEINGKPRGELKEYYEQRLKLQETTGKAGVIEAFNYTIEKKRGWDYGALALISQVSAHAQEYKRFRQAALNGTFLSSLSPETDPIRLALVHLAVPSLGNIAMDAGETRLRPPTFKVEKDFEMALKLLEPIKSHETISPIYAEVRHLACKEEKIFCDGLFEVRQAGRSHLTDINHAEEAQAIATAAGYSDALLEIVIEEKYSTALSEKVTRNLPLKTPKALSVDEREVLQKLTQKAERVSKKINLLGFDLNDSSTPQQVLYVAAKYKALEAAKTESEKALALFNFYETFVIRVSR